MPKAIFFDLDETLIENAIPIQKLFTQLFFEFEAELGSGNQESFFAALRPNIASLWGSMFLTAEAPEQQLIRSFEQSIAALDISSSSSAVQQLAEAMFERLLLLSSSNVKLHEGATVTLARLRTAGFQTGIITNGIEQLQLGKIRQLDLQQQVDHVTVSAQARAHKPNAAVFELALERAAVDAHHAWQIGDHATNDVAGAIRAGMSGVFFDPTQSRTQSSFAELEVTPTHVIAKLTDVLELLNIE